jgi:hypothetical protein
MLRNITYYVAALLLFVPACLEGQDAATATTRQSVVSRGDTIVSPALARAIAETYQLPVARHVRTSSVRLDAHQRTAMYGFNFEEGGFVIVGGDFEFAPILAYADDGMIDVSAPLPGLDIWEDNTQLAIEAVRGRSAADDDERRGMVEQDREHREAWLELLDQLAGRRDVDPAEVSRAREIASPDVCYECPPPPPKCTVTGTEFHDKLMASQWGQGCGYNLDTPTTGVASNCYHSPTGCVATAMGQVVHYHRHDGPWFNFDVTMANGEIGPGMAERAMLLHVLGVYSYMNYGDYASSASTANANYTMQNFGYSTVYDNVYVPYSVINPEVASGRPVLLTGSSASSAHMWVVDGTKRKILGPSGCQPTGSQTLKYFHYNWGWNGTYDGWYYEGDYRGYNSWRQYIKAVPVGPH